MIQQEIRKGPWTEQEDFKLVYFVGLFGDRRWDFIAKVSGLSRTGKSCRLRWVNYLHPDLKRGKMTPQEERLVIELHSKWGNSCQSSQSSNNQAVDSKESSEESSYDTGGPDNKMTSSTGIHIVGEDGEQGYSMDDIWKDIAMSIDNNNMINLQPPVSEEGCNFSCPPLLPSWDYYNYSSDQLWVMDELEESKMLFPVGDQYFSCYGEGSAFLTG
ncbi:SANT/Myb domain [Sesbania bispinosa]|nr:SANT/Myb domain [Sesbania bispinosa]